MFNYSIDKCLCCGSGNLNCVLDLGLQPPANRYRFAEDEKMERYPLALNLCDDCYHSQLTFCVDREELFNHYAYVSGTSKTLRKFFTWFAQSLGNALHHNASVLELAANDGSLIREMTAVGLNCVGVDPAHNIVSVARKEGLPIIEGYWPQISEKINREFDAIICLNVLAHVDDPLSFLLGCKQKLSENGVIIVQPSQARMFANNEFDTIYHEHISFFNTGSIGKLADRAGLKLVDGFFVTVHGDSPVYILQHSDASGDKCPSIKAEFSKGDFAIPESLFEFEQNAKLYSHETYEIFREEAQKTLNCLVETVNKYRVNGFEIVFVGAAAKAMTVVNAARIKIDKFLDENPLKIGRYPPINCGKIEALDTINTINKKSLFILSAWNFRNELIGKIKEKGVPEGSEFFCYFPKPGFFE